MHRTGRVVAQMTNSCDQRGPRSLLAIVAPDYPTAVVKVKLDGPGVVVVVGGETDASNADQVSGYIRRSVPYRPAVIVDVNGVRFLGVQGLRALMVLGAECGRAGVTCYPRSPRWRRHCSRSPWRPTPSADNAITAFRCEPTRRNRPGAAQRGPRRSRCVTLTPPRNAPTLIAVGAS
jgi:anti-anti-sigma regulatory factor